MSGAPITKEEMPMRRGSRSVAIFAALLMIALPASGQTFPDRIIKIVVAAPPGGGLDVLVRALAQELTARWGKSVVVDNRPGASGLIAAEAVANAPPDGYTWLAVTDQIYLSNRFSFKALPYNPDAFANISLVAQADQFVLASAKLPVRDIRELIALDRQKPGSLAYGSWGDGSAPQLLFETMNKIAGTTLLGVPYKGVAPVLNALSIDEVQLSAASGGTAGPLLKAGKVKPLAIAGKSRAAEFPDVPTTAEAGYPTLQAFIWFGLAAPPGTPAAIIERASTEIRDIAKQPAFTERYITSLGWKFVASTPAEMDAAIKAELPVVREMIFNAGVKPQ
jgi:tripartite-type tricarboxylate transporter receptor subunit TctC